MDPPCTMCRMRGLPVLLFALAVSACSRPAALFVEQNARSHIEMLAGTIGSRPAGTPANERARAYIVDQLKLYGFDVRVQETDARRQEIGRTARVSNIIGVLRGDRPEAFALISHYDSVREGPGAGDDAFGVAVSLEAARNYAARPKRLWSLFVLVTDAEESGLMGAAAVMTDREVSDRLRAYINVESVGAAGPVVLFETGPGNRWLTSVWARRAPHPRGGSYTLEVYRRLPNDTDFSIIKRYDVPGLNFASVGDSHAYHTARDSADRFSPRALRDTGENVASMLAALDSVDITQRTSGEATYFDIGGVAAVSYGQGTAWLLAAAALGLGVVALLKVTFAAIRSAGVLRWLMTLVWSAVALAASIASMVGATWALRAARETYHPWYAYPNRLFLLLITVAAASGWAVARIGRWLPAGAHAPRHPAMTWAVTLPLWICLAVATLWAAPAAAHLWVLPLLAAGLLLVLTPADSAPLMRAAAVVILAVSASLWLREAIDLSRFVVAVFGRLPQITPVFVYAALIAAAGVMLAPPLVAAAAGSHPLGRPKLLTGIFLAAIAAAAALAYAAPAYTYQQPLRRYARAIQDGDRPAIYEVGSTEPGLDLENGAPQGWTLGSRAEVSVPVGRLQQPFVFSATGPGLGDAPAQFTSLTQTPLTAGIEISATVVPREPGLIVTFIAPPGLTPARSNLPGIMRLGRWSATYVAPPPDGIVWRASFASPDPAALANVRVIVNAPGFPGGEGPQRLPAWLPQERTVWAAAAIWILAPPPNP
jgi:peptidase M28-like protein